MAPIVQLPMLRIEHHDGTEEELEFYSLALRLEYFAQLRDDTDELRAVRAVRFYSQPARAVQ
jgi:hypothetical protein